VGRKRVDVNFDFDLTGFSIAEVDILLGSTETTPS
jgi:hypothetical protein